MEYRRYDIIVTPHVSVGMEMEGASPLILYTSSERDETRRADKNTDRDTLIVCQGVASSRLRDV